ncbi:MAG: 50S ribosomal protein L10 [Tissierellia bacterium]|nr:50S ribosomal protein L10 [Tissierellia bacterium]
MSESAKVLERKKAIVEEIKEKIQNSPAVVLVDYRGLNVQEVTELRSKYREANVDYKVYKNSSMRFAFKDLGYDEFAEFLTGPNAIAFSTEDEVSAARITQNFAKDNPKLEIKAGLVDGKIMDVDQVKELASIPAREVLIAKLLGSMRSPLSKFVYLMDALAKKKEEDGEEGAEAPVAEEATEEKAEATEEQAETTEEPKEESKEEEAEETAE